MNKLVEKLRKQREFTQEIGGGKQLIIRRMSELQYTEFLTEKEIKAKQFDFVRLSDFINKFVVDWRGFTELDFDPGGSNDAVKYDSELLKEWMQDRVDVANTVVDAVWESFFKHVREKAEAEKK